MPTSPLPTHDADPTTPDPDARGQRIDALLSEYSAFGPRTPAASPNPRDVADGQAIPR